MTSRPYLRHTVVELSELFEQANGDARELAKLAHELKFRQTPKAKSIARKIVQWLSRNSESSESSSSRGSSKSTQRPEARSEIMCEGCGQKLRLPVVINNSELRCPRCQIGFRANIANGIVSVVFSRSDSDSAATKADKEPMTVEEAYRMFDAKPDTPWEIIETCRRRLLQQYHPDKVASLGPKLRKVAEIEGNNINVAFQLLRKSKGM